MRGMKKAKQTKITFFCGEEIVVAVREKDLVHGAKLFSKCSCGINWNLAIRNHKHRRMFNGEDAPAVAP